MRPLLGHTRTHLFVSAPPANALTAKAARSHWFNSRRGASDLRCPANSNPRAHLLKRLHFALHLHAQNLLHWRPPRDAANNHEHALDLANYTLPVVGRKGARRGD